MHIGTQIWSPASLTKIVESLDLLDVISAAVLLIWSGRPQGCSSVHDYDR